MQSKTRKLKRDLKKHPEFTGEVLELQSELSNTRLSLLNFYHSYNDAEESVKKDIVDSFMSHIKENLGEELLEYVKQITKEEK